MAQLDSSYAFFWVNELSQLAWTLSLLTMCHF